MKTERLLDLPIKHLDYVFSPPGLPLPAKGETDLGTTSILVRGGAGTGKTTFALALAHATAKAGGGVVLYLTTEFSPVEITFKATLIGLPEEAVEIWPGSGDLTPGGVVVEHLSEVRHGEPVLSSTERRRSSIDAIWGLLHPTNEEAPRPTRPVRSVVIDALTLPEAGENDGAQRAELVAFIQALENEGISVVLVEELAPGAAAWSSFVVDVVFELAFQPDPETQDLRRKLTLSKCRYSLSIPGPHDYGLEGGAPAAWPDLFRVITIAHADMTPPFRVTPPRLALPVSPEGKWAMLGASIILSPYNKTSMNAPNALAHTPGITRLDIRCGGRTSVGTPPNASYVNEDDGVHAIGWAALSAAKLTGANLCFFNGIERLLSRPDSTARVSRLLEALQLMGFMVCIHSPRGSTRALDATADYIWDRTKQRTKSLRERRHRSLSTQLFAMPWMIGAGTSEKHPEEVPATIPQDDAYYGVDDFDYLADEIPTINDLCSATAAAREGRHLDTLTLGKLVVADGPLGHQAAWLALHFGADWYAACAALGAIESGNPAPTMLLLWKATCAAIAANRAAINELKALVTSPDEALILAPLLRGLAASGQFTEADGIIAGLGSRHKLAPWMLDRLRADTCLDSNIPDALRAAAKILMALTADESLPPLNRADNWHNLGTAQDRLNQRDAAIASFQRAAELNPLLDVAREELERLQAPMPVPS